MFLQTKLNNILLVDNLLRYVDYKVEDNKTLLYSLHNELTNGYIACIFSWITFLCSWLLSWALREINDSLIYQGRRLTEDTSKAGVSPCFTSTESDLASSCITVHLMKVREVL